MVSAMSQAAALRESRTGGYETARPDIQSHVPTSARAILDLGCSTGALGAALKARQEAVVVGVELDPGYARDATARLDRVVVADAASFAAGSTPPEGPFDCLIAADVLEHLADPWTALRGAAGMLAPGAAVVVSLPNVLFWAGLLRIVRGRRWPRDHEGVFDGTHLRWFAEADAVELLEQAGLGDVRVHPRYWVEGAALRRRIWLARTPLRPYLAPQHVLTAVKAESR
jgi:2-polyprenyl-3-methyl-5-hydroxy-6-metoxy-1,4-benzoquinol methylase